MQPRYLIILIGLQRGDKVSSDTMVKCPSCAQLFDSDDPDFMVKEDEVWGCQDPDGCGMPCSECNFTHGTEPCINAMEEAGSKVLKIKDVF